MAQSARCLATSDLVLLLAWARTSGAEAWVEAERHGQDLRVPEAEDESSSGVQLRKLLNWCLEASRGTHGI